MANEANCESDKDHASAAVREEWQSNTSNRYKASHGHDINNNLGESPREDADDKEAVFAVPGIFGNLEHTQEKGGENGDNQK